MMLILILLIFSLVISFVLLFLIVKKSDEARIAGLSINGNFVWSKVISPLSND